MECVKGVYGESRVGKKEKGKREKRKENRERGKEKGTFPKSPIPNSYLPLTVYSSLLPLYYSPLTNLHHVE